MSLKLIDYGLFVGGFFLNSMAMVNHFPYYQLLHEIFNKFYEEIGSLVALKLAA